VLLCCAIQLAKGKAKQPSPSAASSSASANSGQCQLGVANGTGNIGGSAAAAAKAGSGGSVSLTSRPLRYGQLQDAFRDTCQRHLIRNTNSEFSDILLRLSESSILSVGAKLNRQDVRRRMIRLHVQEDDVLFSLGDKPFFRRLLAAETQRQQSGIHSYVTQK
jgi:hypothetical protein